WLLPLVLPFIAAVASGGRPRWLVAAGGAGLGWLLVQGFVMDGQPGLGWGALVYALAATMLAAYGLARRGWCKGDAFTVGAIAL
ncbi:hypothetical protein ABTL48_21125, partial [Acinetobacter baumannii]